MSDKTSPEATPTPKKLGRSKKQADGKEYVLKVVIGLVNTELTSGSYKTK